jgi:hypothetical protein
MYRVRQSIGSRAATARDVGGDRRGRGVGQLVGNPGPPCSSPGATVGATGAVSHRKAPGSSTRRPTACFLPPGVRTRLLVITMLAWPRISDTTCSGVPLGKHQRGPGVPQLIRMPMAKTSFLRQLRELVREVVRVDSRSAQAEHFTTPHSIGQRDHHRQLQAMKFVCPGQPNAPLPAFRGCEGSDAGQRRVERPP